MNETTPHRQPLHVSTEIADLLANQVQRRREVFAALVNSEPTCATLLALASLEEQNGTTTQHFLHKEFLDLTDNSWKMSVRGPSQYCDTTLIPNGLVYRDGTEYFLTDAAKKYGIAAAQYLLHVSETLPHSLRRIFGQTPSAEKLGPVFLRAAILEYLSQQTEDVSASDIASALGVDYKMVGSHLQKMSDIDLVEYTSAKFESRGEFIYEVTLDHTQIEQLIGSVYGFPTLTRQVLELMGSRKQVSAAELSAVLQPLYAGRDKTLSNSISVVLSSLAQLGACAPSRLRNTQVHSACTITPLGRRIVQEVVTPVVQIVDGHTQALDSSNWRTAAPEVVARYAAETGTTKRLSFETRVERILELVRSYPDGIRPNEIGKQVPGDYLSPLRHLLKEGRLRQEKRGRAVYYFLREKAGAPDA